MWPCWFCSNCCEQSELQKLSPVNPHRKILCVGSSAATLTESLMNFIIQCFCHVSEFRLTIQHFTVKPTRPNEIKHMKFLKRRRRRRKQQNTDGSERRAASEQPDEDQRDNVTQHEANRASHENTDSCTSDTKQIETTDERRSADSRHRHP